MTKSGEIYLAAGPVDEVGGTQHYDAGVVPIVIGGMQVGEHHIEVVVLTAQNVWVTHTALVADVFTIEDRIAVVYWCIVVAIGG